MASTLLQLRVDSELKKQADELFNDLGLDTTTAIRMFLKAALNKKGLPFKIQKDKKSYEDDFYNPINVEILKEGYKRLQNGQGVERELIDA